MLAHFLLNLDAHDAALRFILRAPLVLPQAVRAFLLAWLANVALQFAPPVGTLRSARDRGAEGGASGLVRAGQRCADAESIGDPESPRRIYVDLSDVICHAIWHDTCAGIPRVQLEIATRLARSSLSICVLGRHRDKWRQLGPLLEAANGDVDQAFALLKESFSTPRWNLDGLRLLMKRRRRNLSIPCRAEAPDLKGGDCLFIGGAFWTKSEVIDLCKQAAANGAHLVVLFHDLIPLSTPAFCGHDFAWEYLEALRLPAHFVVTSEFNRSELKRVRTSIDGARGRTCSSVLPLADEFPGSRRGEGPRFPSARLARLAGQDFALCVGTIEIRKNHHALLGAWDDLAAERGPALPKLVIAGRRGWKAQGTLTRLDALAEDGPVVFIEAPTDNELRWLYASCLFTVFPSLFEGWGLPVGESFWFGKPCAASNAASIAPVARGLCATFSPYHPEEMKDAIRRLLDGDARKSFKRKIEAAPLRNWSEVAADIEALIVERRPVSDALAEDDADESVAPK